MKNLALQRYPHNPHDLFQAWNSADEYIVDYVIEHNINSDRVLIIEDEFGALGCGLNAKKKYFINDSILSIEGIKINREVNFIEDEAVFLSPFEDFPDEIDLIVVKVPKNNTYLEFLLNKICKLDIQVPVIAGGMDKHLNQAIYKIFNTYCNGVQLSKGWKKSRLIIGKTSSNCIKKDFSSVYTFRDIKLKNLPNVFSQKKPDIGSMFLINEFKSDKRDVSCILDIGCGNGILGLYMAKIYERADLIFNDITYSAIESAKYNAEQQNVLDRSNFNQCHTASDIHSKFADIVICNPPFHDNHKISVNTSGDIFVEARRILKCTGELHVVSNRHLNYYHTLRRLFGNCITYGANSKFVVYKCIKNC